MSVKSINNEKEKNSNSGLWYALLAIITLIVAIIGATYAYKLYKGMGNNNDVVIKAGTLSVKYVDGDVVNNSKLIPRFAPEGINDIENAYKKEFVIKSTGTLDQNLIIYFDVDNNDFSDNTLKYILYEGLKKMNTGYINGEGKIKILNNSYLHSKASKKYTLIIWIDENGENQNSEKNKNIAGKFIVDAIQYNN